MDDKLKHLRSAMDETVFRGKEFTEKERSNVRRKIDEYKRRQSLNIFQRLGLWFKPVLSVAVCLFLLVGGIYVVTHQGEHSPDQVAQNPKSASGNHPENNENATPFSKSNHDSTEKGEDHKENTGKENTGNENTEGNSGNTETKPETLPVQVLVSSIVKKAKEGKIPNFQFVAGKTTVKEVIAKMGDPHNDEIPESTNSGRYMTYMNKNEKYVAFGYGKDSVIYDVRSFDEKLRTIALSDIKEAIGDTKNKGEYNDESHYQRILTYNLNDTYQLKWVLPMPTEKNPDPHVDHISVYNKMIAP